MEEITFPSKNTVFKSIRVWTLRWRLSAKKLCWVLLATGPDFFRVLYFQPIRFVRFDNESADFQFWSRAEVLILGADQTDRGLCGGEWGAILLVSTKDRDSAIHGLFVKSGKSDWLKMQNEYSAHAQKIGSGQRSRFSVLTRTRIAYVISCTCPEPKQKLFRDSRSPVTQRFKKSSNVVYLPSRIASNGT